VTEFGYTMRCEQSPPDALVDDVRRAEEAVLDFSVISDRIDPCGPDVEEQVEKIRPFLDAGFTEVALVQIGGERQEKFTAWAERELLPALRGL